MCRMKSWIRIRIDETCTDAQHCKKSQAYQDQRQDAVVPPAGTGGWSSAAGGASLPLRGCAWSPSGLAPLAAPPEVAYFPPALRPKQGVTKRCRLPWLTNRRPRI
jgi:hypothetical protein